MRKKPAAFSESLRRAILAGPKSQRAIGRETGIGGANISRFVHGRGGFSMESLDVLIEYLDLELVPRRHKGK
jgi:hypothetical protein